MRILIVDDSRIIRDRLTARIRTIRGVTEVREAGDGAEALAAIGSGEPDIVILDIRMPKVSGFEVLKAVRSGQNQIRVVVLTADLTCRDYALQLGADYCFDKGMQTDDVYTTISELIEQCEA